MSRDTEHIPFRNNQERTRTPMYQSVHETELPSFTNYKDMIGAKLKNGSRDFDHAPFRGGLSPLAMI